MELENKLNQTLSTAEMYKRLWNQSCDNAEPYIRSDQLKHIINRFLQWRLPSDFCPDGGISFQQVLNEGTPYEHKNEPVGTNLLSYTQAEEMIRYILKGSGIYVKAKE